MRCKAGIIRNLAFPAAMAASVPVSKEIGAAAFKVFRDGLLRDAGNPSDPVEIMLLEQLTLAHLRVGQLHAQVEITKNIEAVKVYSTAAVRLTGEVRRLALALKQYREPSARKQFTVVRQQNVSAAGQQIAYVAQSNSSPKNSLTQDGELTSKRLDYAPNASRFPNPRRQAAGRRNRLLRCSLTPEGRERLRQTALKNRPWKLSTGPRTEEGKKRSAANGRWRQKVSNRCGRSGPAWRTFWAMIAEMDTSRRMVESVQG